MKPEHRRPLVAAVAVLVMCAAMVAHGMRTDALGVVSRPMQVIAAEVLDPAASADRSPERAPHEAPVVPTPSIATLPPGDATSPSVATSPSPPSSATRTPSASASTPASQGSAPGAGLSSSGSAHQGQGQGLDQQAQHQDQGEDGGPDQGSGDQGDDDQGDDVRGGHHGVPTGASAGASAPDRRDVAQQLLGALQDLATGLVGLTGVVGLSPASEPAPPSR